VTAWLLLAIVGAAVALDGTSFPQVMFSRPIVSGALGGLVFGRPLEGAMVGVILEVYHVGTLPIGAARYPEGGTAACAAAGGIAASGVPADAPVVLVAVVLALVWERLTGRTVEFSRRLNERIVQVWNPAAVLDRSLERRHLAAAGVDGIRGVVVTISGALATVLAVQIAAALPAEGTVAAGALGVAGAAMLGGTLRVFGGWHEKGRTFLLGVVCGLILLAVA
jgi:PTS system mannose-specific IIC component